MPLPIMESPLWEKQIFIYYGKWDANMLAYLPDIRGITQQHEVWQNGSCTTWDIAQPNAIMLSLHIVTSRCLYMPIPVPGYLHFNKSFIQDVLQM